MMARGYVTSTRRRCSIFRFLFEILGMFEILAMYGKMLRIILWSGADETYRIVPSLAADRFPRRDPFS